MTVTRRVCLCAPALILTVLNGSDASAQRYRAKYAANIHGLVGNAHVELTRGRKYNIFSGVIKSPTTRYSFSADIYGAAGYGNAINLNNNNRFRIHIRFVGNKFVFTANPLRTATKYVFVRKTPIVRVR